MSRIFARVTLAALSILAALPLGTAGAAESAKLGRFIVVLDPSVSDPHSVAAEQANKHAGTVGHVYSHALKGYSVTMPVDRVEKLERTPRVAYVVRDMEGDALVGKGGTKGSGGTTPPPPPPQTLPTGIRRIGADVSPAAAIGSRAATNVDLAVIDTGVDSAHPDLNVVGGYWCGNNSATGFGSDADGHGTHVAGTMGAKDNELGVVGVSPGARIYSLRVPDRRNTWTVSAAVCAVDWITAQKNADGTAKIEAANMSFRWDSRFAGFPGEDDGECGLINRDPLHQAICTSVTAGTTYVAAAGNEAWDASRAVPAGYDEVITVSALADSDGSAGGSWPASACRVDQEDTLADFSNYGLDVDIIAPGVCINSTRPGGTYGLLSGTSMAAPHVAGAAGLFKVLSPAATAAEVQAGLTASGNFGWNPVEDKDGVQEPLLDVSKFGAPSAN